MKGGKRNMKVKRIYREVVEKQDWKGFVYTGEIIEIEYEDSAVGTITNSYRVVKGKFTPYGGIRDCGDHYIKANYSSYDRIDKKTLEIEKDVEDR
ncbi:MAG: hypothetical protein NC416_18620 [Eubacterium sp.]|nr:hypothetical protein [Eubacterium sp.]